MKCSKGRSQRPHCPATGNRGQRLFTTRDPPARRDFRNALLYVDMASRSSRYFGTRDVVELQTLELFLHVWDSVPPFDLPPSSRSLTVCDYFITSPSPDGRSPTRAMPILRPPTFSEPRSPLHRPPLQHRTASPAQSSVPVEPQTEVVEGVLQCPVPVTHRTSQNELFPRYDVPLTPHPTTFCTVFPCGTQRITQPYHHLRHPQQW